jgi:hypothetical protein
MALVASEPPAPLFRGRLTQPALGPAFTLRCETLHLERRFSKMSNWYCTFNADGGAHEVEQLKKVLDELWSRVEIKGSSHDSVSVDTIQGGLLGDGWSSVETMVAQFPALSFTGTIWTTRYREYEWAFEGRGGAITWQTSYDEEIAEGEAMIRAYYAADEEITQAIHKKAAGYKEMSAAEIAETDAWIDAYYAAFREAELQAARQEERRAAEDCVDPAELGRRLEDILKRLSASSPIAETQDQDRP